MAKFKVTISQTNFYVSVIDAETEEKALEIAKETMTSGRYQDFGADYFTEEIDTIKKLA